MKKFFLTIILFLSFNIYCFDFPTDLNKYKYKGNIKQVISKYYNVEDGKEIFAASSISYFSKKGNYEKIEFFDSSNNLTHYIFFEKKENTRELVTYSKSKEIIETTVEEYDSANKKMTEKYIRYDGKTVFTQEYKFDEKGLTLEKSVIDSFGNTSSKTINEYNQNNNLIGFTTYFKEMFGLGSRTVKNIFKLDEHGNVIESLDDFRAKKPITKYLFSYKYDKLFNIIEQKEFRITREKETILVKVTKKEYKFW